MLPDQNAGEERRDSGATGECQVAAVDKEQAAEQQRLDVRARAEDVAGEDHAPGKAADEDQGNDGVLAGAPAAQSRGAHREGDRGAEGTQRRGEAQAVRQDQPRKGGGADRVGEESQPPQHDPGAEQAGGDGEDQHLD